MDDLSLGDPPTSADAKFADLLAKLAKANRHAAFRFNCNITEALFNQRDDGCVEAITQTQLDDIRHDVEQMVDPNEEPGWLTPVAPMFEELVRENRNNIALTNNEDAALDKLAAQAKELAEQTKAKQDAEAQLARQRCDATALRGMPLAALEALERELEAARERLRLQIQEVRDQEQLCNICFDSPKNVAFVPCGHRACAGCVARLLSEVCPSCNQPFARTVRLF